MVMSKYTTPKVMKINHYNSSNSLTSYIVTFNFTSDLDSKPKKFQVRDGKKFGVLDRMNDRKKTVQEREAIALDLASKILECLKNGYNPFEPNKIGSIVAPTMSISEIFKLTIDWKKKQDLSIVTIRNYQRVAKIICKYYKGGNIVGFTKEAARDFLERHCSGKSGTTYNTYLTYAGSLFSAVKEQGFITENPFDNIKTRRARVSGNKPYSIEQVRELSKQLQEHNQNNLYICCMLMYYAGIRIEECRKLKVENIDFANGHITIWSSSSKTTFTDSVPLHNSLRNILASHCRGKTSSDYIFVSKNGDWVNEDYFKSRFKRLKSEDKITIPNGCTLCSIRHTFFVNLYRATKDIYLVMRVARHKSVNTTMRYLRSLGENINNDNISMIETL